MPMRTYCSYCHKAVQPDWNACPNCGHTLNVALPDPYMRLFSGWATIFRIVRKIAGVILIGCGIVLLLIVLARQTWILGTGMAGISFLTYGYLLYSNRWLNAPLSGFGSVGQQALLRTFGYIALFFVLLIMTVFLLSIDPTRPAR